MALPHDYVERVYAGVLGKIIGVYLGRPFENWSYDRIMAELGEITGYVYRRPVPLVVTDDDISGTFTFLRAMPDHGNRRDLTSAEIGETWLNYIIDRRAILWWGGLGNSTEHTAYLRLKHGIEAPRSGSIAVNGQTVAEQIGAQIFIDGWAMIAPGDPELAVDLAGRAGRVSHDGEAVYAAQVIAAIESQAFVESDLNTLIDLALGFIPKDSTIARAIADVREWHAAEPDWRVARERLATEHGYHIYPGVCPAVPNHALIILSLLYGNDDFRESLKIVNTSGWDTDCNSGNVGCILGIKNGLDGIDSSDYDWRGPVADRLYLATADGGRAISDAAIETVHVVNIGRALAGEEPIAPKDGARFHFSFPGSVQGFQPLDGAEKLTLSNEEIEGGRALAARFADLTAGAPVALATPTFIPPDAMEMPGYTMLASPTLYSGQTATARVLADAGNTGAVDVGLIVQVYGAGDALTTKRGPVATLAAGDDRELSWTLPDTGGRPIAGIGLELSAPAGGATSGTVYLDRLAWGGAPDLTLGRPAEDGVMWQRAWVDGLDHYKLRAKWPEPYRLAHNEGTGLISQGTADWVDYRVEVPVTVPMARRAGVAARVCGLRRYYALVLSEDGTVRLERVADGERTLASAALAWTFDRQYNLALEVVGGMVRGWVDGELVAEATDDDPLPGGGVGLVLTEGTLSAEAVRVSPAG